MAAPGALGARWALALLGVFIVVAIILLGPLAYPLDVVTSDAFHHREARDVLERSFVPASWKLIRSGPDHASVVRMYVVPPTAQGNPRPPPGYRVDYDPAGYRAYERFEGWDILASWEGPAPDVSLFSDPGDLWCAGWVERTVGTEGDLLARLSMSCKFEAL
jgi:hypothetical protein